MHRSVDETYNGTADALGRLLRRHKEFDRAHAAADRAVDRADRAAERVQMAMEPLAGLAALLESSNAVLVSGGHAYSAEGGAIHSAPVRSLAWCAAQLTAQAACGPVREPSILARSAMTLAEDDLDDLDDDDEDQPHEIDIDRDAALLAAAEAWAAERPNGRAS